MECVRISNLGDNTTLTSVSFLNPDTEVGVGTFSGCSNLVNVELPKNLLVLESSMFFNCTGLKQITIPESVTEIESDVFWGCSSLENVTLGSVL